MRPSTESPDVRKKLDWRIEVSTKNLDNILSSVSGGDLFRSQLLFSSMVETWPMLGKAIMELVDDCGRAPLTVSPYSRAGTTPTESAKSRADLVRSMISGERCLARKTAEAGKVVGSWAELIRMMSLGYFFGITVAWMDWGIGESTGCHIPSSYQALSAYHYRLAKSQEEYGRYGSIVYTPNAGKPSDWPEGQIAIAYHAISPRGVAYSAPLRTLIDWWIAARFAPPWFLQYCQVAGYPFRSGEYTSGDANGKALLDAEMGDFPVKGFMSVPSGTAIGFHGQTASQTLPWPALIEEADSQAIKFILGQSLTTSSGGEGGSFALGKIHEGVRRGRLLACLEYAMSAVNSWVVPEILRRNFGDSSEAPTVAPDIADGDEMEKIKRDKIAIMEMGVSVEPEWLYERHRIPRPSGSSETFKPEKTQ